jgi:hypothetical protein
MENNIAVMLAFLIISLFGSNPASAQIRIKLPDINIKKPDVKKPDVNVKKPDTKINETTTNNNQTTNNKNSGSELIYPNQKPNNVPVLLKNTIHVKTQMHDEYWKMKGQRDFTSWVPLIRFNQFYNNDKELKYTVEYFNPDGSAWYSELLESSGRNADRTVLYQSPSPYGNGVLDTKSTNGTGVYSFKITNSDTKELLFQGKFKVGKFSRSYSAADKNKNGFYVDYDWVLPFSTIGFHFSGMEIGGFPALVDVWLKGYLDSSDLEGRIFYKGQQIASTKDGGGANSREDRESEYAVAFNQPHVWRRWQFQWKNILVDNNGSFNRENYPNAHYLDKNQGEYTVKIYHKGTQIRELSFTVGTDGRIVAPAYTNQIPLPYHTLVLPTKVMGTEKWDTTGWKTNAFYGNPLTGFEIK